ncbi:recombinase family protein, partial [Candidatus Gottesmanbacteria bacterium]|nr:recombinase family protein [Candidatus Gottesmanbacteria bacterium]
MKYIAYCRKSTDEKDRQVLSIEAQVAEIKEYAKREQVEISEFITESRTAKEPGRPLFADLIGKIERGLASGIIAWHPDRLARNSIDGGRIIYLIDIGKLVGLKFPTFWFDNTPQGKFMLSI